MNFNIFNHLKDKKKKNIMGILNLTPDSFFDGGLYLNEFTVLKRVEQMLEEGADIIDIGGYSTRPGAKEVSENEELKRIAPYVDLIFKKFPEIIISIDTYRSGIAEKMIKNYQVSIINDVSGGILDENMFRVMSNHNDVFYVLMHMRGNPQTMQSKDNTIYSSVVDDVFDDLKRKKEVLNSINVNNIIIDPGFGFSKSIEQNYELLKNLSKFITFEKPILVGLSRKSMLWKVLDCEPKDTLTATTVVNTMALINGASILRVHDVKQAADTIKIFNQYRKI
jgi:dihydropteroate synthase